MDVEARIGTDMAKRALWLGPLVVLAAGLLGGWGAAWAALVGAVVVTATFWVTGRVLSWSARRSPTALGAVTMAGFLVRLAALTILLWVFVQIFEMNIAGLFIGMAGTYMGLVVLQARKELIKR